MSAPGRIATGVSVRISQGRCVPATSHHYRAAPTLIKTLLLYSGHRRCGGTVEAGGFGSGFESRRMGWSPQVLSNGNATDRLHKTRNRTHGRTSATRIVEFSRVLGKPASGARSELVVTVNRVESRTHGQRKAGRDWTRRSIWAAMAGSLDREKGVCS